MRRSVVKFMPYDDIEQEEEKEKIKSVPSPHGKHEKSAYHVQDND